MTTPDRPLISAPERLSTPIGDTGLNTHGGYITEEFLPELQGLKGLKVYRRMASNDATVGAMLLGIKSLILGADMVVQAANDTEPAQQAKEWVEGAFDDMDTAFSDVLSEALSMLEFGFAPLEITLKPRNGWRGETPSRFSDGKLGLHDLALRQQTSLIKWEIEPKSGKTVGMWQQSTWSGAVQIPRRKLALFRTSTHAGNPEGRSILRTCYRSWFYKTRFEELEAIGAERNNAGVPIIRIPSRYMDPSASAEEKAFYAEMQRVGARIRRDQQESIVVASDIDEKTQRPLIDMSLLTPGGKLVDIAGIIARYDQAMARSVLADFIFLGSGPTGSLALSSDKTSLFAQSLAHVLKRIGDALTRDVVRLLWEVNEFPAETMPKITFPDLEKPDLGQLTQAVSTLFSFGGSLDRETENIYRKAAGLPEAPEQGLRDQGAPGAMMPDEQDGGEPGEGAV